MVASYGSCHLVKKCAEVAFGKHHYDRAMLAGDIVQEVGPMFDSELKQNKRYTYHRLYNSIHRH